MATTGGPNIATDGLVFAFDTTNEKSFVGEPTVNITPNYFLAWSTLGGERTPNAIADSDGNMEGMMLTGTINSQVRTEFTATLPSTETQYTFSVEGKRGSSPFIGLYTYLRPYPSPFMIYNVDTGEINGGNGVVDYGVEPVRDGWYRIWMTVTVRPDQINNIFKVIQTNHISIPGNGNVDGFVYYAKAQLEEKPYVTSFTKNSRSSTESLLDQTKNNTLDVSYVSFDPTSKSKMVFDGTDDRMILPSLTFQSVELVMKINSTQGSGWRYLLDARSGWGGGYFANVSPGGWVDTHLNGELIDRSDWFNIVPKDEYFHFYLNAPSVITDDMNIMTRVSNNENLGGEIMSLKLYDRKLTTEEIQHHYLSFKSKL